MEDRMKYPIGIQSFDDLRNSGFVYVDKTQYIHQLNFGGKFYFLSRPRRFGKSLFVSTLEAYFLGKKELFKGLAIEQMEQEWTEWPVLYIDFNCGVYDSVKELDAVLDEAMTSWENKYGVQTEAETITLRFKQIIERVFFKTGKQVVVLVDEYDKPLLQCLDNKELQDKYRSTLKAFYGNLKSQGKYIKFAFITGVSKFSKVSIFSDLNNLNDISISEPYAGICGITESELHSYFKPTIQLMAEKNKLSYDEMNAQLKERYDGYRFSRTETEGVYNPFSLLHAFYYLELSDYWFESGTPTFLAEQLKNWNYDLRMLQKESLSDRTLKTSDSLFDNPISLLFQTGYLTIKDYDSRFQEYTVGFPNKEVELGFLQCLLPYYISKQNEDSSSFIFDFVREVEAGKLEEFLTHLQSFFCDNDYRVAGKKEIYFQNAMYLVFRLMGFYTKVERATSQGRIDVTVQTPDYIYIIEVKLDGSPEEALQQIEDNNYTRPFAQDTRKLFRIGINFSSKTRCVEGWKIA